jgi:flagellar motility protein MotE (MotC chaperone)
VNLKKALIIITGIVFLFILLVLGTIVYYKYDKTLMGILPAKKDSLHINKDLVKVEPLIVLTRSEFDLLQSRIFNSEILRNENQLLSKSKKALIDSIGIYQKKQKASLDSIKIYSDTAGIIKTQSVKLNDSLNKLNNIIQKLKNELALKEQLVKDQEKFIEKRIDSLDKANFSIFSKIYNNTNPADIAKILEKIDERDAAKILKNMQKRKAGKVLEAMKPEQAAAILMLGAGE